ncbi:MCE family protein [Aeromicrobium sp. CTD01-1L150]|uniref:MCE family protein n=1 Tax=Aeromicrobium sp. CTD01-1L150 TaxID=3341830 RepID=UPI0035BF10FA
MIEASLIDRDRPDTASMAGRGLVLLVVLGVVAGLLLAAGRGAFSDAIAVTAHVDDAGGALTPGADVKLDGVIVGSVTSVDAATGADEEGLVEIAIDLTGRAAPGVSRDVTARVLPATVFGTTYVDLLQADPDGEPIAAGQVVEQDRSTETLELQDTLDSTERILSSVEPAELSVTLGALADALDGRGEDLGQTIETLGSYLEKLEPEVPLLREDLRLLAQNMQTLADVAPDLLDASSDAMVTARTLTEERAQLTALIAGGNALVGEADAVLTEVEEPFVRALAQSAEVVQAMYDEREGFPRSLTSFIDFAAAQATTFEDGSFMATDVHIKVAEGRTYPREDCPRYGSLSGPRCSGDGTTSGTSSGTGADPDAALVAELRSVLASLEDVDPQGVGALLARPYLDGGGR